MFYVLFIVYIYTRTKNNKYFTYYVIYKQPRYMIRIHWIRFLIVVMFTDVFNFFLLVKILTEDLKL